MQKWIETGIPPSKINSSVFCQILEINVGKTNNFKMTTKQCLRADLASPQKDFTRMIPVIR